MGGFGLGSICIAERKLRRAYAWEKSGKRKAESRKRKESLADAAGFLRIGGTPVRLDAAETRAEHEACIRCIKLHNVHTSMQAQLRWRSLWAERS